jgi:transposase
MLTLPPSVKIWCATTATDLRRGFDGPAAVVRSEVLGGPLSGRPSVFHNRRADRIKVLCRDRDGFALWYKRLERGRFHFPAADAAALELTPGQLQLILDGIDAEQARRFKRCQRPQPA